MRYVRWHVPKNVNSAPKDGFIASVLFHAFAGVLSKLLPRANPDFDARLTEAVEWWIEVDDHGVAIREIGFDANGLAIFGMPFGRNYGYLTDSNMTIDDLINESVIEAAFEEQWQKATRQFAE